MSQLNNIKLISFDLDDTLWPCLQTIRMAEARTYDCLHVGDDPIRDIEAAASFGMKTVWMNRTEQMWPSLTKSADISVSNLEELVELLPR